MEPRAGWAEAGIAPLAGWREMPAGRREMLADAPSRPSFAELQGDLR
jgi:hypothetical protein